MPFLLETSTIEECIKKAYEFGCEFVELNMSFPQNQLHQLKELNWEKVNPYHLSITLHLDEQFTFTSFQEDINETYLRSLKDILLFAKERHIPIVNMHLLPGTYVTLPGGKVYLNEKYFDDYFQRICKFKAICEESLAYSETKIGIENTSGWQEYEQKAIHYLLESNHFGLTLDVGHLATHQFHDLPFYQKHQSCLIHMHLHDADDHNDHLPLDFGTLNWRNYWSLANQYKIRTVLEVKTLNAFEHSLDRLNEKSF